MDFQTSNQLLVTASFLISVSYEVFLRSLFSYSVKLFEIGKLIWIKLTFHDQKLSLFLLLDGQFMILDVQFDLGRDFSLR